MGPSTDKDLQLFDSVSALVVVLDAEGRIAFWNLACSELTGYRLDEVRGWFVWQFLLLPAEQDAVKDEFARTRSATAPSRFENYWLTKDGQKRWIHWSSIACRSASGDGECVIATGIERTAGKEADERLRRSEDRFSSILRIAADAIISVDGEQRIVIYNEGAEKIFGWARGEVIGRPLDVLIPEQFREAHRIHIGNFTAAPEASRRMGEHRPEIVGVRKSGEVFPAEAAISKLDVGGELIFTVVLRDITAQKRIEREQRFLADAGPVLATTLDLEETLSKLAELAVRIADFCIIDLLDEDGVVRRLRVLARETDKTRLAEALRRVPLDRERPHLVWSVLETQKPMLLNDIAADVLRYWAQSEAHLRVLRDLETKAVVAVPLLVRGKLLGVLTLISSTRTYGSADLQLAEDLAYRAALSIENARLYRVANSAIQGRDDVLRNVAHDLRNPLYGILLAASLLHPHGSEAEHRLRNPAEEIARAAKRMDRLIQDLLDVTRMEAGHLTIKQGRVPAAQVVSDALEAQRPLAESTSLELQADLAPDLADVSADRDRLLQVFENLIGNALKFTDRGGRVTVGAALRDAETLFWVADTGQGIAAEDVPHLFEPYWQVRKDGRRGAGLGLPIIRGIVEAHGGRVWVESTPARGSTFYFTIPTAPRGEDGRREPSPPGP